MEEDLIQVYDSGDEKLRLKLREVEKVLEDEGYTVRAYKEVEKVVEYFSNWYIMSIVKIDEVDEVLYMSEFKGRYYGQGMGEDKVCEMSFEEFLDING